MSSRNKSRQSNVKFSNVDDDDDSFDESDEDILVNQLLDDADLLMDDDSLLIDDEPIVTGSARKKRFNPDDADDTDADADDDDTEADDTEIDDTEADDTEADTDIDADIEFYTDLPKDPSNKYNREVIVVKPENRRSQNKMTQYELTEAQSIRADQIDSGSNIFVDITGDEAGATYTDAIAIAAKEINERRCPLVLRRKMGSKVLPDGKIQEYVEDWSVNELAKPYVL